MRLVAFVAAVGAIIAFAGPSHADPSTGQWLQMGTTDSTTTVRSGGRVVFAFPVGAGEGGRTNPSECAASW